MGEMNDTKDLRERLWKRITEIDALETKNAELVAALDDCVVTMAAIRAQTGDGWADSAEHVLAITEASMRIAQCALTGSTNPPECDYEHWRSSDQWKRGECFIKPPCPSCGSTNTDREVR